MSWGLPVGKRAAMGAVPMQPLVWVRAGWVTQIWGGLGILDGQVRRVRDSVFAHSGLVFKGQKSGVGGQGVKPEGD